MGAMALTTRTSMDLTIHLCLQSLTGASGRRSTLDGCAMALQKSSRWQLWRICRCLNSWRDMCDLSTATFGKHTSADPMHMGILGAQAMSSQQACCMDRLWAQTWALEPTCPRRKDGFQTR